MCGGWRGVKDLSSGSGKTWWKNNNSERGMKAGGRVAKKAAFCRVHTLWIPSSSPRRQAASKSALCTRGFTCCCQRLQGAPHHHTHRKRVCPLTPEAEGGSGEARRGVRNVRRREDGGEGKRPSDMFVRVTRDGRP